jgi:hypothetical protein
MEKLKIENQRLTIANERLRSTLSIVAFDSGMEYNICQLCGGGYLDIYNNDKKLVKIIDILTTEENDILCKILKCTNKDVKGLLIDLLDDQHSMCAICNGSEDSKYNILNYFMVDYNEKTGIVCKKCNKNNLHKLNNKKNRIESGMNYCNFNCDICNKKVTKDDELGNLYESDTKTYSYRCDSCDEDICHRCFGTYVD